MYRRNLLAGVAIIVITLLLTACYAADDLVNKLKNAPLPYDSSTTVEQFFNNYRDCGYIEWIHDQKENGQYFVIVRCFIQNQFKQDLNKAIAHFKQINASGIVDNLNRYIENQDKIKEIYQDFSFRMTSDNYHATRVDTISTVVVFYPDQEALFTLSVKDNASEIHHIMKTIYEKHSLEQNSDNGITPYVKNVQKAILSNKTLTRIVGIKNNKTPPSDSKTQN